MTETTLAVSNSTRDRLADCKPDTVSYDEYLDVVLDAIEGQKFEMRLIDPDQES
jgi:hypothetical protein